jgi:adenylate cyclase
VKARASLVATPSRAADLDPVPWGLGFARRLVGPDKTAGMSPRAIHALRLGTGMIIASAPPAVVVAGLQASLGNYATAVVLLSGVTVAAMLLALTLRDVRRFPLAVHAALLTNQLIVIFGTVWQGGVAASGMNPLWGLLAPICAMLLLGRRAALFWGMSFVVTAGALLAWQPLGPVTSSTVVAAGANLFWFGVFVFLALQWFVEQREIAERLLDRERRRADALLADVLPASIAERLKRGEEVAESFDEVSVLFADLVGFTPMCAELEPGEVVALLGELFREFDELIAQHGVEKIKSIGDCYMIAAGVPEPRADHAAALARLALELRDGIAGRQVLGRRFAVRIGMHIGPAVGGIIGTRRFVYDLWGDTVNTASRMESYGEPGRIQVTREVRDALSGQFRFSERGETEIAGKGTMTTYWLEGTDP